MGTVEDISEAHRAMATVDITRATAPMEVNRTTTTSSSNNNNNNILMRNKEEEARAKLCLSGGKGCIAWPNTGRTNSIILPVCLPLDPIQLLLCSRSTATMKKYCWKT